MTIGNDPSTTTTIQNQETIGHSTRTQTQKQLELDSYEYFLSDAAKKRKPSAISQLMHLDNKPGMISLLTGKPNDAMFPIESLSFTLTDPSHSSHPIPLSLTGADLTEGLQYTQNAGIPRLVEWFIGLQEWVHGRKPSEAWSLTIGSGSQDMIYKAINAIVNPDDPVLIESPVYVGFLPIFSPFQCELVEVATDENGVCSSNLRSILENWPEGKPRPKAFYTVPFGSNPTGMTTTTERRREILQLAREYNFLILEDDPYYFLYFGKDERPPSYFQLELEVPGPGRVVRFDSLSKVISAGMRVGFASGPKTIIDAMNRHTSAANLHGSPLIQAITLAALENWGYSGFLTHTGVLAEFYREKRDIFEKGLQTHLGELAEWRTPDAGMYFWFKLHLNPNTDEEGDSKELIQTKAQENNVIALPGSVFFPDGRKTAYVRASFCSSTPEEVDEALSRFRVMLLNERDRK